MFGGDNNYISYDKKGSYKGLYTAFLIDINGTKCKPNVLGKDFCIFLMDKSGQILVPGSSQYAWLMNDDESKLAVPLVSILVMKQMSARESAVQVLYLKTI